MNILIYNTYNKIDEYREPFTTELLLPRLRLEMVRNERGRTFNARVY